MVGVTEAWHGWPRGRRKERLQWMPCSSGGLKPGNSPGAPLGFLAWDVGVSKGRAKENELAIAVLNLWVLIRL